MSRVLGDSLARTRFAALLEQPTVPLAEAALAVAEEEYPHLPVADYLSRLEELASRVSDRLGDRRDAASKLRSLRTVLFDEEGFRGNSDQYYDPRNSFLNEVLDRRLGIPITLSIVYLEVASRVGLSVQGVAFPGHFLVKHASGDREIFIDAFRGGELLSADDCAARYRTVVPGRELDRRVLEGVSARHILARMLHNLKKIYVEASDDVRALWVVDRLLLLTPGDPAERRDRGLVEARLGGSAAALADLEAYLSAMPGAADADEVRDLVQQLRGRSNLLN
jgi:regulator of sirC expression with transglutaminase-like and TPR domain